VVDIFEACVVFCYCGRVCREDGGVEVDISLAWSVHFASKACEAPRLRDLASLTFERDLH
jgi:hypothetical protein